jgi:large subunit ribosomal protein L24
MSKAKLRIKRDDTVVVIAGKEKGKVGKVLLEGVRRVKRHQKPVGENPGAIVEKEAPIHVSNVALWDANEKRRVKVAYRTENDTKVRADRKTGRALDRA